MSTKFQSRVFQTRSYETPVSHQIVLECENVLCTSNFSDTEGIEDTLYGDPTEY